jgi:glycosyltransferase involved in cell wall biosynthesis
MKQNDRVVLYLSYDGLSDPLGQSQILPYLFGLAGAGYRIVVVSVEKPAAYEKNQAVLEALMAEKAGDAIRWVPVKYYKKPLFGSSVWNLWSMYRQVLRLLEEHAVGLVHCRSYMSALIGLKLKQERQLPFLFDIRGFWVEERIEGGLWDMRQPLYRRIHRYFKRKESQFFQQADAVVLLTEAARQEVEDRDLTTAPVHVIPCCADLHLFNGEGVGEEEEQRLRQVLSLAPEVPVLSYLGSLGTWYMLEEMLDFFKELLLQHPEWVFLFITKDRHDKIWELARARGIDRSRLRVVSGERQEMPALISLSTCSIFFIRPTYSKKASSPTKHAELLGMGIPVFCNAGVGDTDAVAQASHPDLLIPALNREAYAAAIARLPQILATPRAHLRSVAREHYSLSEGVETYAAIYRSLLTAPAAESTASLTLATEVAPRAAGGKR